MVLRRYAFALRPGWVALHVLTVALVVTMVLLGRWQLMVSNEKHFNVRNFGYALQWWAFSVFVLIMWVRMIRDQLHHQDHPLDVPGAAAALAAGDQVEYRRYVMPQLSQLPTPATDSTHAAYNDYLARLAAEDAGGQRHD